MESHSPAGPIQADSIPRRFHAIRLEPRSGESLHEPEGGVLIAGRIVLDTEICSAAKWVYHLHLVPVRASVGLPVLTPTFARISALTCSVFLERHVNEETPAFAADISRKHTLAGDSDVLAG